MDKKKIRFFINTLSGGGAEKVIVDLVNNLEDYNITLLSVSGGVHEKRLKESVHYIKLVKGNHPLLRKLLYKMPPALFAFLFLRGRYDLEVAYLCGFSTKVVAAKKAKRKIAFVHTDLSLRGRYDDLYTNFQKALNEYQKFDKVCFVSEVAQSGFEKKYGYLDNSCVIHNVINVSEIKEKSLEPNNNTYSTNGLKIISLGRLVPEKGYTRLVEIAARLEKDYPFEIWILGEGPERQTLENLIAKKHVSSVKLLGFQENPYPLLKKADVFVCSSLVEGYSTAVTEALVLGLPVLTTNCAGMNEILNDGVDGIIVQNSEEALETKIKGLLCDSSLLHTLQNGASQKSRSYSNEYAVKEYVELFNSVL